MLLRFINLSNISVVIMYLNVFSSIAVNILVVLDAGLYNSSCVENVLDWRACLMDRQWLCFPQTLKNARPCRYQGYRTVVMPDNGCWL